MLRLFLAISVLLLPHLWDRTALATSPESATPLSSGSATEAASALSADGTADWREALCCGPNALYIFLRCHGSEMPYSEIRQQITLTERGCSLADLLLVAKHGGVHADVIKADLKSLEHQSLPAIVLLDGIEERNFGHFTVAIEASSQGVVLFDPIRLVATKVAVGDFQRIWSGYAMVISRQPTVGQIIVVGISALLVIVLLNLLVRLRRRWKPGIAALCCVVLIAGCGSQNATISASGQRVVDNHLAPSVKPFPLKMYPSIKTTDISFERWRSGLKKFRPVRELSIPTLLHLARLQKIDKAPQLATVSFTPHSQEITASDLVRRLLDHREFARVYPTSPPFLTSTKHGARFSETSWSPSGMEQHTRESHKGQTLSILGELGIAPDVSIHTAQDEGRLEDVLDDSAANFTYDEEPYWLVVAFLLYRYDKPSWTNKYGHEFSFDDVFQRLLSAPLGNAGPCGGTHVLQACAVALQVAEVHEGVLSSRTQQAMRDYLHSAVSNLEETQDLDGSWSLNWTIERREAAEKAKSAMRFAADRDQRIWITGHHLEWLALTRPEHRISADRLLAAARFVVKEIDKASPDEIAGNACYFSHGPHALIGILEE